MFRLRSNCRVTRVAPRKLVEVISFSPAMRPNWRSRGVATAEAMISALAPGSTAVTSMVGNSTWGSGATGKNWYAIRPAKASAMVSSVVPMGRWMNRAEKFMRSPQVTDAAQAGHLFAQFGMDPASFRQERRGFSTFAFQFGLVGDFRAGDPVHVYTGLFQLGHASLRLHHRLSHGHSGQLIASLDQYGVH